LPGINPENIEVTMENSALTMKGQRQEESKEQGNNYLRTERVSERVSTEKEEPKHKMAS